ncbi:MAG: YgaP family membrane protein [Planctomycetota bacterium]|jgi:hypothetical protein
MVRNMGWIDRSLRIFLAVAVGVLVATGQLTGVAAVVLGAFSVIFVITSFVGFCPLYTLFGFTTCRSEGCSQGKA